MKTRRNIIVDDELLEKAREVTGEKTYSGAIEKALQEITRRERFREALERYQELADRGELFYPDHLESIRPAEYSMDYVPPKRRSADEVRAPRKKSRRRAATR